jgi:hypothetical protein
MRRPAGGVVHGIDEVMLPPDTYHTVRKALKANAKLKTAVGSGRRRRGRRRPRRPTGGVQPLGGATPSLAAARSKCRLQPRRPPGPPLPLPLRPRSRACCVRR